MRFAFTDEQVALRSVTHRFLAETAPLAVTRNGQSGGGPATAAVWSGADGWARAAELGLTGVHLPEKAGGTGLSAVELAIVAEEMGAVLYPGPFLASVATAGSMLADVAGAGDGDAAAGRLLRAVVEGRVVVLCAEPASPVTTAQGLTGHFPWVLQADLADVLLVPARAADGRTRVYEVDPSDAQLTVLPGLDPSRNLVDVRFDGAPARPVAADAGAALHRATATASVALAAEMLGGARQCLDLAVRHARDRVQFGQPIGTFQAVQHRLADLLVEVELATSAVYLAACHAAAGDAGALAASVPMALATAADTFTKAGKDTVQVLGGLGFTWEHEAHLYVRRARVSRQLLGGPASQRERLYATAPVRL